MQKLFTLFAVVIISLYAEAQTVRRPKLVVGIVVDQMRWDYLYRFYDRYTEDGGFKRIDRGAFGRFQRFRSIRQDDVRNVGR